MRMLITDLDNTLYDWVTFFANAFKVMVTELSKQIDVKEEQLLTEFKAIHQRYETSEQPFAILELPSVLRHFGKLPRGDLVRALDGPLHAFNSSRKRRLKLYESVAPTMKALDSKGSVVVGHTEAIAVNAYYRLRLLDIVDYFRRLYSLEGHVNAHPVEGREEKLRPPDGLVRMVPRSERKPNPQLLLDICNPMESLPDDQKEVRSFTIPYTHFQSY